MANSLAARFWAKVSKSDGCWEWKASINPQTGYGSFNKGGVPAAAHRVAYELSKGEIGAGLQVHHVCRNRRCVNPDHLQLLTSAEHNRITVNCKEFSRNKTHCPRGHEYSPSNTLARNGRRFCKACAELYNVTRREARRNAGKVAVA